MEPAVVDVRGNSEPLRIVIHFKFEWFESQYGNAAQYKVSLHQGLEDRFDRIVRQPYHDIHINKMYQAKLTKIKLVKLKLMKLKLMKIRLVKSSFGKSSM